MHIKSGTQNLAHLRKWRGNIEIQSSFLVVIDHKSIICNLKFKDPLVSYRSRVYFLQDNVMCQTGLITRLSTLQSHL